jgi:imidazolonepropionase-like amidohydrolase
VRCAVAPLVIVAFAAACASTPAPQAAPPSAEAPPTASPVAPGPPSSTRFAIVHVTVVDPASGATSPDRAVVVDGDRIVTVIASDAVPPGRVVDARGKYVIPGLWDMHVHFVDPASARLFVANGVTGVRVMWGNPEYRPGAGRYHSEMRAAFDAGLRVGPRMLIASNLFEGPHPLWPHSLSLKTEDEARRAVDLSKASGDDFIKVYSGLDKPVFFAIADEAKKDGMVFAGHVPDSVTVAEASDAGQKSIEHLTGMLMAFSSHEDSLRASLAAFQASPHSKREHGEAYRAAREEARTTFSLDHGKPLLAKLAQNRTWQTPTLTVLRAMATLDDPSHASDPRLAYVSPYVRAGWDPTKDFRMKNKTRADYDALRAELEEDKAIVVAMAKAGVPILAGTDEGNPFCFAGFSLHDELALLVSAGLSPVEALRAATSGPAAYLERETTMGSIAEGMVADLVLLDDDPLKDIANTKKIAAVVSRGVYFDRPALDRLLEEAKR